MFAAGYLRGWPKSGQPPVQAVGVKHVPGGVSAFLLHAQPNKSRAKTITLDLYDTTGRKAERVRVEWPGWSDCEMHRVHLEYA